MQFGTTLKTYCPPGSGDLVRNQPGRVERATTPWFPFVFPWASLRRISGIVFSGEEITLVRGRIDGRFFQVESVIHEAGDDPVQRLRNLDLRDQSPALVSLLRNQTLVRHFRVPTESATEIEAMLPHLLAGELPLPIDHFSWVWLPLPTRGLPAGFTQVTVYVARNDRLQEFLTPLVDAGLNIVGLIPEGWSWAHVISEVFGREKPANDFGARSVIIRSARAHLLVVECAGQPLFDMIVPLSACCDSGACAGESEGCTLDWSGPGFAEAREKFESLLGFPLPRPVIWPDAIQADKDFDQEKFFFPAAVAVSGLGRDRLLMPPELQQRVRRRTAFSTAAKLGRLAILATLAWLALTVVQESQTRQYLMELEQQLAAEAPRVEVLEAEVKVIRENNRERADSTEILQILTSLRQQVKAPIYLAHLNYVQGRGVTLRGGAPASSHVLEMTEKLSADPLWQGLRVMQLQSEKRDGTEQVNFVVEGQLN